MTAARANPRSRKKARSTLRKVRDLHEAVTLSTRLTSDEGAAFGMLKAAFGFGGRSNGKEEL